MTPSRILVTRTDRLGDLVLSTPIFSALREKFPHAHIAALVSLENHEVIEGNPHLDEILLYDKKGTEKSWRDNLIFAWSLRKKKFDLVIHLHATNRIHFVTWLAGIPSRIGWARKAGWMLTEAYPDRKKEGLKHEAEYNFDILKSLAIPVPEKMEMFYPVSSRARASFEMLERHLNLPLHKPWIVLNPSASCPSKKWPAARFSKLADKFREEFQAAVFLIGTEADRELISQVKENMRGPVFDLSGRLSLGMLGALLKKAELLVSNDSGPVHIASALGIPVISIFGRKQPGLSPQRWRPLGANARVIWKDVGCETCLAHLCQIHFLCLDAIPAEEVFEAAAGMLSKVPA